MLLTVPLKTAVVVMKKRRLERRRFVRMMESILSVYVYVFCVLRVVESRICVWWWTWSLRRLSVYSWVVRENLIFRDPVIGDRR